MKTNDLFEKLGHWVGAEEIERQKLSVRSISISKIQRGSRNNIHAFRVHYCTFDPKREGQSLSQQWWYDEFAVRNYSGNLTSLGKMMGIGNRDKRIFRFSSRGREIEDYLCRLAKKFSGRLTRGTQQVSYKF